MVCYMHTVNLCLFVCLFVCVLPTILAKIMWDKLAECTASTIDQFFTWKPTFFGPNSTFPSPHAMLFVRKDLPKSRPTLHRDFGQDFSFGSCLSRVYVATAVPCMYSTLAHTYMLLTEREVRTGEYCSSSLFTWLWSEPLRRGP